MSTSFGYADDTSTVAIVSAKLIDGVRDAPRSESVVLAEGETIKAVGGRELLGRADHTIDLGSATLLPGMIDAHVHPLMWSDDYQTDHLRNSSAYKALRGLRAVQNCLEAGWTSLRITGDADVHYAVTDLKRAIDEGHFLGPRITGAGHYISISGGGGDVNYYSPEQQLIADGLVVDGVDEMRRAVREEVKYGSDWIKLMVTGAFMSAGDNPKDVHLSDEELAVAMKEAARLGVPVMAHAHSAKGIVKAAQAGARSIEHGTFLDEEGIQAMLEHDTYLVPTLYIGDYFINERADSESQKKMVELSIKYREENLENIAAAIKAGVKVTVGSDMTCVEAHHNAGEFGLLMEAGMTAMQAIQAGTRLNAEMLGWEDRLGTVEPGKLADLIAVPGDPLDDISLLQNVIFVMKGGEVVKQPEQ